MSEVYKDQFTPQKEDMIGPIFLDGICDNPQCREDIESICNASTIYDMYFSKDGVICGAPKSSPN